jgi:hypothetical protein
MVESVWYARVTVDGQQMSTPNDSVGRHYLKHETTSRITALWSDHPHLGVIVTTNGKVPVYQSTREILPAVVEREKEKDTCSHHTIHTFLLWVGGDEDSVST